MDDERIIRPEAGRRHKASRRLSCRSMGTKNYDYDKFFETFIDRVNLLAKAK